MSQDDVHAQTGHEADDALRDREGFAIGRGVSPGHGDFLAFQVFQAAHFMDDMGRVGHTLGRMVDVALEVDQSRLLFEDAVFITLGDGVDDFFLVRMALADVHIVADADDVGHEGNHVGRFADRFAVSNLALLFVQVLDLQAEEIAGRGEGEARTRRIVAEDGNA